MLNTAFCKGMSFNTRKIRNDGKFKLNFKGERLSNRRGVNTLNSSGEKVNRMHLSDWFYWIHTRNVPICHWLVQENKCKKCVYLIGSGEEMHEMRLSDWFRRINARNGYIWLVQENKCTEWVYLIGWGK